MTNIDLSPEQQDVVDGVLEWRAREPVNGDQFLTVGGYAGTGKTTLVSYLHDVWADAAIASVCGKAAHVLRSKGARAQTVHSLIYVPFRYPDGKTCYHKRKWLPDVRTIIIDEASMIDHLLFSDLLSFGLPTLFVGDHGQLEPIGTNPNLMSNPKLRLETIHRQAMGNPILRLATAFREGRQVPRWSDKHGRLQIAGRNDFQRFVSADVQIVCGFNATRHQVNARVREMLGRGKELVVPGDKLICLRNNKSWNIFNGQQVTVLDIAHENRRTIELEIETDDGRSFSLPCLREQFGRNLMADFRSKEVALMDYGYCLTAHKAQGSEWDAVLVLEEIVKAWDPRRWRYTVATRARERLIYCA